eukprot:TRINITY_DN10793_c1_g1_i1.p1 TRINITY_DN10793_c1_g1~~TRINITY_DN10793_c1_g1_i1.p1  ORF type:complete len:846 (+),score=228.12 TRINITY_DN10793_c1_g1_i1:303-2540(+)
MSLVLQNIDPVELLHIPDELFLAYLPLITAYVRNQTQLLNTEPPTLLSEFYSRRWSVTVDVVLHRVHSNPDIGARISWMENMGIGISSGNKLVKKDDDDPSEPLNLEKPTQKYEIKMFHLSSARVDTERFFYSLAKTIDMLDKNYVLDNLCLNIPTKLLGSATVKSVKCLKFFNSKARPVLMEWTFHDIWKLEPAMLIFKKGEDLTKDLCAQTMFTVFNMLWANSPIPKSHRPYLEQYTVLPVGRTKKALAVIDFIPNTSVENYNWSQLTTWPPKKKQKFLRSIAGAFLMGYCLSLRDRHKDNMLIRDNDTYLMIDFEFILCDNPKYAPQLAIARGFQHALTPKEWETFEKIMAAGFQVLRNCYSIISFFAQQMLGPLVSPANSSFIPKLIQKQLMLDHGDNNSVSYFISMVNRAPGNFILFLKNVGHTYGQSLTYKNSKGITDEQLEERDKQFEDLPCSPNSLKEPTQRRAKRNTRVSLTEGDQKGSIVPSRSSPNFHSLPQLVVMEQDQTFSKTYKNMKASASTNSSSSTETTSDEFTTTLTTSTTTTTLTTSTTTTTTTINVVSTAQKSHNTRNKKNDLPALRPRSPLIQRQYSFTDNQERTISHPQALNKTDLPGKETFHHHHHNHHHTQRPYSHSVTHPSPSTSPRTPRITKSAMSVLEGVVPTSPRTLPNAFNPMTLLTSITQTTSSLFEMEVTWDDSKRKSGEKGTFKGKEQEFVDACTDDVKDGSDGTNFGGGGIGV